MWQFLKSIFLAQSFLLTPTPVDISGAWMSIPIKEPMESVNPNARLEIDVSGMIDPKLNVIERMNEAKARFPPGCVEARTTSTDGREVLLANVSTAETASETFLTLRKPDDIGLDIRFTTLSVRATCPISAAKIYWRNSGK